MISFIHLYFKLGRDDKTIFYSWSEDDTVRYRNVVQKYCVRWKNKVVVKAKFQFSVKEKCVENYSTDIV